MNDNKSKYLYIVHNDCGGCTVCHNIEQVTQLTETLILHRMSFQVNVVNLNDEFSRTFDVGVN